MLCSKSAKVDEQREMKAIKNYQARISDCEKSEGTHGELAQERTN